MALTGRLARSPLLRIGLVLWLVGSAHVLALLLAPVIHPNYFPLFAAAVGLSSWIGGLAHGLGAAALSTLLILYFFVAPAGVALAAFVAGSGLLAWLCASLRQSRDLFTSTLCSIEDAVVAFDRKGRVRFINPIAETLSGWNREQAKGRKLPQLLNLVDASTGLPVKDPVETALRENRIVEVNGPLALAGSDGRRIPIEHTVAPILDRNGERQGAILVLRDVSGRLRLQQELRELHKMEAVGRLAGGVAHDFNNLLTVITGYAETLRSGLSPLDPLRSAAEEIVHASERAAMVTRRLLAFSRQQPIQHRMLDLNAVVRGAKDALDQVLGKGIELNLMLDSKPAYVRADQGQVEQTILNLAMNARDAMPDGGTFTLETGQVEVESPGEPGRGDIPPGSYALLAASDSGLGMDDETRSRAFEPFFTTKEKGEGAGLGLSTVYGFVKQSAGYITVFSKVGCGTIFEIYLPHAPEGEVVKKVAPKATPRGSETILVAEDEEDVRKMVAAILRSKGYKVYEARDGQEACDIAGQQKEPIHLVLTDILMPRMDGLALTDALKPSRPKVKVLYMSGYMDSSILREKIADPATVFLYKPFTPDALMRKVRDVLDS
ncbi:MAG: response regulator [Bryobacteraceae bacterium]